MKVFCFLPETLAFQNKLGMLTRSAGVDFQPCMNENEVLLFAEKEKNKRFFLFVDSKKSKFLYDFSINNPECNIVIILFDSIQNHVHSFLDRENINSFVATNNGEFDARELLILLKKFELKNHLGLDKYLNFPAIFNEKKICNGNDKNSALEFLENFIYKISNKSERTAHYAQRICNLADELLLNAIFESNPKLKDIGQDQNFNSDEQNEVKIKWGFDGELFGLSVCDSFGKLSRKTVMKFLDDPKKKNSFFSKYSGGLGIKMIYDRLHHYIVNVQPNKMTEIICLLRFDKKFKDFDQRLRSFHYFLIEEDKKNEC